MSSSIGPVKWAYPDSERLWKLALKIEEKQLWAGYISEQEHIIWRKALRNKDSWNIFLAGHGEGVDPAESQDHGDLANGVTKVDENMDTVADPVSTAFRARSMLFDCSIRKLFPLEEADDPMNFDIDDDTAIDGTLVDAVVAEKPKTREIEDDNYDDDDEIAGGGMAQQAQAVEDGDNSLDNLGMFNTRLSSLEDEPPSLPEIKSFPVDTYYHTLEHDRVAMLELQTVEVLIVSCLSLTSGIKSTK